MHIHILNIHKIDVCIMESWKIILLKFFTQKQTNINKNFKNIRNKCKNLGQPMGIWEIRTFTFKNYSHFYNLREKSNTVPIISYQKIIWLWKIIQYLRTGVDLFKKWIMLFTAKCFLLYHILPLWQKNTPTKEKNYK